MTNEEAIKEIKKWIDGCPFADTKEALDLAIKALEDRTQGKWVMDNEHTKNPLLWYKCNLCGVYQSPTNFCPNCGAVMTEK